MTSLTNFLFEYLDFLRGRSEYDEGEDFVKTHRELLELHFDTDVITDFEAALEYFEITYWEISGSKTLSFEEFFLKEPKQFRTAFTTLRTVLDFFSQKVYPPITNLDLPCSEICQISLGVDPNTIDVKKIYCNYATFLCALEHGLKLDFRFLDLKKILKYITMDYSVISSALFSASLNLYDISRMDTHIEYRKIVSFLRELYQERKTAKAQLKLGALAVKIATVENLGTILYNLITVSYKKVSSSWITTGIALAPAQGRFPGGLEARAKPGFSDLKAEISALNSNSSIEEFIRINTILGITNPVSNIEECIAYLRAYATQL